MSDVSTTNTTVTIDLDKLIELVTDNVKKGEQITHMQVEGVLKSKLYEMNALHGSLLDDWEELLETIEGLFLESPQSYDEDGYMTQPIEILEFAKRKMDDLQTRVDDLERAVLYSSTAAASALPQTSEDGVYKSIPNTEEKNVALTNIKDYCDTAFELNPKASGKIRRNASAGLYKAAKNLLSEWHKIDPVMADDDESYGRLDNAVTHYEQSGNSMEIDADA